MAPPEHTASIALGLLTAWRFDDPERQPTEFKRYLVDRVGEGVTDDDLDLPLNRLIDILWWEVWLANELISELGDSTGEDPRQVLERIAVRIAQGPEPG